LSRQRRSDDSEEPGADAADSSAQSETADAASVRTFAQSADAAIDQFRAVAKWMISAFAAAIALMLTGVQLTSINNAQGSALALSILGIAVPVLAGITAGGFWFVN
jgi:hypothetical protein